MRRLCASAVVLLSLALLPCSLTADDAALQFAGVVLYPDGSPAAGAKVWLCTWQSGCMVVSDGVTTAADGSFAFAPPALATKLLAGFYNVFARADGYAYAWTDRMRMSDPAMRLVLQPEVAIRGMVTAPDGSLVAGVRPEIGNLSHVTGFDPERIGGFSFFSAQLPPEIRDTLVTETDADGVFVVHGLPAGVEMTVSMSDPNLGTGSLRLQWLDLATGNPISLGMCLTPGGTVRGRVTDAATGKPVAGVHVRGAIDSRINAITDAEGRYEASGAAAGRWSVYLHQEPAESTAATVDDVDVRAGEVTEGVDLQIIRGLEIRGRVTDVDTGAPVEGATICCTTQQQPEMGIAWPIVTTGPDGTYSLRAPEGPATVRILSMPHGWRSAGTDMSEYRRLTLTADNAPSVADFGAVRARSLSGTVLGPDGAPAPQARVLLQQERGSGMLQTAFTDGAGRFSFENLDPGSRCTVRACRGDAMTLDPEVVELAHTTEVELRLSTGARGTLSGRIVSTGGEPIFGAVIRVDVIRMGTPQSWGPSRVLMPWWYTVGALSDRQGHFSVPACWPGMPIETSVRAPGHADIHSTHEALSPGERCDLGNIVLDPANLTVSGITVDEGGDPVPYVPVEVRAAQGRRFSRRKMAESDREGRFSFSDLPSQRLVVFADTSGYASAGGHFGPEPPDEPLRLRVIPLDRQMLFSHVFPDPPEAKAEKLNARLVQICRFKGFDMEGTLHQYLGLGLELETAAEETRYPGVWVVDDQGRELERTTTACVPFTADCTRVFELPEAGVKALARIIVGTSGPTTHTPDGSFTRMHVFDPVVSGRQIAVLQSAELADAFIRPKEPGEARPGKGRYIRARVYLACDETTRYRVTSAQADAGIDLHEAWTFDYRDGTTELDLPDALKPMEAELLEEAHSALRLLPQLAPGGRTIDSVQCLVLQSLGDHEQPEVPKWLGLTVTPRSIPDAFTAVFENIPIPPELTRAVEME